MIIDSTYSKSFYTTDLNSSKHQLLLDKAIAIRDFKNTISETIHSDFLLYLDQTRFDLVKQFNTQIEGLTGQDIQIAIGDVYETYSNKYQQIQKKLHFEVQTGMNVVRYKRNTKSNKKGDVKCFGIKVKSTRLSKVLGYIARYGYEGMLPDLRNKQVDDPKKQKFYDDVVKYLERYGEQRLLKLGLSKRSRCLAKYNREPIEFKSLSFRTISRIKTSIVDYNKNYGSVINAFVNIGGYVGGKLQLPVVFNKHYHGKISDYRLDKSKQNTTSYTVCFDGRNRVRVVIPVDGTRDIPDAVQNTDYLGVDVNVKHNLFTLSTGDDIDYDRHIIKDYVRLLKRMDKKKERKSKMGMSKEEVSTLSNRDERVYNKAQTKIKDMLKRKCSELVKKAKSIGLNHLVFEDLQVFGRMFSKSEEYEGFRYSRLCRCLNLSDIKNIVQSIAHKAGLSVSFVNAEYTSQQCNQCSFIDRGNRKSQEEFRCTECGFESNADVNASRNIVSRILQDVLVRGLLMRNDFNEFRPRVMSRSKLKEIILSHSYGMANA
jgi:IS605 OrfB family transposase